jgi:hypothetical protein
LVQHGFGRLSFGQHGFGRLSFGQLSFGQLSFGQLSFGRLSFGRLSFGRLSFGRRGEFVDRASSPVTRWKPQDNVCSDARSEELDGQIRTLCGSWPADGFATLAPATTAATAVRYLPRSGWRLARGVSRAAYPEGVNP